ncbi:MAG: hypothetical protein ACQEQE_05570, partial [Bacillota bacterium]
MNKKGIITIEAVISMSAVIILMTFMIFFLNTFYINEVINQSMYATAVEVNHSNLSADISSNTNVLQEKIVEKSIDKKLDGYLKKDKLRDLTKNRKIHYSLEEKKGVINLKYSLNLIYFEKYFEKEISFNSFIHKSLKIPLNQKVVYKTKTGKRFHKGSCFHLYNSKIKTNIT